MFQRVHFLREGPQDLLAGRFAMGMQSAAARVRVFEFKGEPRCVMLAPRQQFIDPFGAFVDQDLDRGGIA